MLDSLALIIHIAVGAVFGVTIVLMQTTVGPAMARIPAGGPKSQAAAIIQGRARLAMDIAIIIQTATAVYLAVTRWGMIGQSPLLMTKVTFGIMALAAANLLHFYWRGKKARLKAAGRTEEFEALSSFTLKMEKIPLVTAPVTLILGIAWGHL